MSVPAEEPVNAYLDTVARIEPDIAMLDAGAALASIAISLRRIADAVEGNPQRLGLIEGILEAADRVASK